MPLAALRQAAEGRGTTLMVVGDAGMGKTRYARGGAGRRRAARLAHAPRPRAHRGRRDPVPRGRRGARAAAARAPGPRRPPLAGFARRARRDLAGRRRCAGSATGRPPPRAGRGRAPAARTRRSTAASCSRSRIFTQPTRPRIALLDFLTGGARGEPLLIVATTPDRTRTTRCRACAPRCASSTRRTEVALGRLPEDAIRRSRRRGGSASCPPPPVARSSKRPPVIRFYAQELARAVEPSGRRADPGAPVRGCWTSGWPAAGARPARSWPCSRTGSAPRSSPRSRTPARPRRTSS